MFRFIRNRWFYAGASVLLGLLLLLFSWLVNGSSWWSGALVNAGTALLLFAPLAVYGRHIEQRFDRVQEGQKEIERQQEATVAEIASLSEEVSQAQGEMRRTREELAEVVAARLATSRVDDLATFSAVGETPTHRVLFDALSRASVLGLISSKGCRVHIKGTNLYLRFEAPTTNRFGDPPDPQDELDVQLEDVDGRMTKDLQWRSDQGADDFLVELSESLIGLAQYPGDRTFGPDMIFIPLQRMLELAHRSATGGSFEPLTSVIEFCPPQWVVTSTHLIAVDPCYAIPIARIREPRWHEHMAEKTWLDQTSFSYAFAVARALYEAGNLDVKPSTFDELPF